MDFVFTNKALLDVDLDDGVLGAEFEKAWKEGLRQISRRALVTVGVEDRVPFVLAEGGTLDLELSELFRTFAGQVGGRTTMASYTHHAATLMRYLQQEGLDLNTVEAGHLATYRKIRNSSGIEPISWNSEAAAIKSLFDAAIILRRRKDNPCTFPSFVWYNRNPGAANKTPDFISLAQFEKFRDEGLAFGPYGLRNVAFANLLLTGGLRLDEGNEYRADWLPDSSTIRNAGGRSLEHQVTAEAGKGHRARKVRISKVGLLSMRMYADILRDEQIAKAIAKGRYTEPPTALWLNQGGMPMGEIGWGDAFRRASERTGIKATPKTIRHMCAVYLLSRLLKISLSSVENVQTEAGRLAGSSATDIYKSIFGDPLRKVQKYLGHARYETTFIYLDILGSHQGIDDAELAVFDQAYGMEEDYVGVYF